MCQELKCTSNQGPSTHLQAKYRSRRGLSSSRQQRQGAVRACCLRLKSLRCPGRRQTCPVLVSLYRVKPQLPRMAV